MADGDDPRAKKPRIETLIEKFQSFNWKKQFCYAYRSLCHDKTSALNSLEISVCDAAAEQPFSKATCRTIRVLEELYPFGSIFRKGVEILNSITKEEKFKPDDSDTVGLAETLLSYLFDENSHECLSKISEAENETQLMVTLARHFFSKLSVSKSFTMDKYATNKHSGCLCMECEKQKAQIMKLYGDTSIGNGKVWHGSLDIILDSCEIGVCVTAEESVSPGGRAPVEDKFCDLRSFSVRDQALAQAITFSFLQRQRHPSVGHFLFPYIVVSRKMIQYFFYDSENDILIQSQACPLLVLDTANKNLLPNYKAVITAWLVLNHKYLCSGPTKNLLRSRKAGFFKFANPVLEVYKTQLKFQNVETVNMNTDVFDPQVAIAAGLCENIPFEWPVEDFPPPP